MDEPSKFTRRAPRRYTKRSVRIGDWVARFIITVGGIGTVAAVLGVCVFLLWVVWPLFLPPREIGTASVAVKWQHSAPTRITVDEGRQIGWAIEPDGALRVFRLSDGQTLSRQRLVESPAVTAWSPDSPGSTEFAVGFADGTVRTGHIRFVAEVMSAAAAQRAIDNRKPDDSNPIFSYLGGLVQPLPDGHVRYHRVIVEIENAVATGATSPVRLLDFASGFRGSQLAALFEDGRLRVMPIRARENLLHEAASATKSGIDIEYRSIDEHPPMFVVLSGSTFFVAWENGTLARFDLRQREQAVLAEVTDLVPEEQARLTALTPLAGRGTLVSGDSLGRVNAWFVTRPADLDRVDESKIVLAHRLATRNAAVTALAASGRSRIVAAGYANGHVSLLQVTAERQLIDADIDTGAPITGLSIAPKEDALVAATASGVSLALLELHHPEATLASLFTPVWYQDYDAPTHVWQSSGGSESNEPKFGVMPLVFGTVKATVYSLLFAVPIALAAAVYTSEFLPRRTRSRIKPTIELMASLPSVVLGYLAAFVLAPLAARFVPAVLVSVVAVPTSFLLAAYLWQLLPERISLLWKPYRFWFIFWTVPLGIIASWWFGPLVERWLFAGNLILWLDSGDGSPVGGWMILMLPLAILAVAYFYSREITPRLRLLSAQWSPAKCAVVDLAKFLAGATLVVGAALAAATLLGLLGLDARGIYLGSYIQRNALIVGFAMGFAVIPIIYTIAEDALSSVPEHLRSASLGAGATPWQTTVRIIIPTAMSGLFSAVMIGLGRAVGETMIVLMAAGNTPIMEWNIFNGFRTLSANLAVELPEAELGSTHFRVLFLTALALFAITFVVNTVAEVIRQQFRRRAYQL